MKTFVVLLATGLVAVSSQAANVGIGTDKPSEGVLAQSSPDGTALLAFDAEEKATGDRYAWGQTFTVPAGKAWDVDAISVQYSGDSIADPDATIKLILFDYDSSTYLAEDWGTYTDPLNGMVTTSRYTEVFSFPTSPASGDWITFDLTGDPSLPMGTYGFALWISSPTAGSLTLINGGAYEDGVRLRIRGVAGNEESGSDLNFVIQEHAVSDIVLETTFSAASEAPSGTITDTPETLNSDFGTNLVTYITQGRGKNGGASDTGIVDLGGVSALGGSARMIDDLSGSGNNDLAEALAVPNDPNGTPLPDTAGLFAEFSLSSVSGEPWYLNQISFENANTTESGESWGIALLHDGDANGYDTRDELGRLTGTFSSNSTGQSIDIDVGDMAALQNVSNATFRFYFWEDYHGASAFNHKFGVSKLTIHAFPGYLQQPSITSPVSEVSIGDSAELTIEFDPNATSAALYNSVDASSIDLLALDDGDGVVVVSVTPTVETEYTAVATVEGYPLENSLKLLISEFLGPISSFSIQNVPGGYDLTVASRDFQHDTDNGLFLDKSTLSGDFQLEARVLSVDAGVYPWAKAGLMVRESNDAQSRSAGVYFTPARGALFQGRRYEAGESTRVVEDALGSNGYARVTRVGDALYGAASSDGHKWTSFGKQTWEGMSASLLTGIGVAGQNDADVSATVETVVQQPIGLYDLTLVDNGTDLRSFFQGDLVDLDYYKDGLSIRAEVSASVQEVRFRVDGALVANDTTAPFIFDLSGLTRGEHLLEVVPYDASGALDWLHVDFDVIKGASTTPPNIVYIFCDDLGYGDTGFNGSQYVFTPELDKLAEAGTRCTAGYVTAPQCGPSRAGMISGMYQVRFDYDDNKLHLGLPEKAVAKSAPETLKDLGYTNAMIGKWHIEQTAEKLAATIATNETNVLPWYRGFDYTYAMDGGSCHYFPYSPSGSNWLTSRGFENRNLEVMEGTTNVNYLDLPEDTYQTTEFTTRAINFIGRNKSNPFFVYLAYNAPHTPVKPPNSDKNLNNHLPTGAVRDLAAAMTGVDREVGRLVDYLESENLLENTVIFFFSDNGGPTSQNMSVNDPFSGFKGDVLEGGIRVPFLISWKGHLPENRDFHDRVFSIDYITSVLHHQRRTIPDYLDGQTIFEDLQGKTSILSDTPRFVIWRSELKSVHRGRYKKVLAPTKSQDQYADLFTNIKEDPNAPPLDPAVIAELDQLMTDFNAEAQNTTNQAKWFDASDTDGDGLLDTWENDTAGNLTTLGAHPADADSDGMSDEQEKAAGTNPLDPGDRFAVSMDVPGTLCFDTRGRRCYQVQSRTNLVSGAWSDEGAPLYGDEQGACSLVPGNGQQAFYRVQLKD